MADMTIKKFIRLKPGSKNTADGFIAAHQEFLSRHTFLHPILEAYTAKEILPTPTFSAIQNLLFTHLSEIELQKAKKSIQKSEERYEKSLKDENGNVVSHVPSNKYLIYLNVKKYDKSGNVIGIELGTIETVRYKEIETETGEIKTERYIEIKPAIYGCDNFMRARDLADRKLVSREDSQFCTIEYSLGEKQFKEVVPREDAFYRQFPRSKSAFCKQTSKKNSTLKWVGKAKSDRSIGPWSMHR